MCVCVCEFVQDEYFKEMFNPSKGHCMKTEDSTYLIGSKMLDSDLD